MTREQKLQSSRERQRRYREKDPEAYRAMRRKMYADNPEKWAKYRKTKKERKPDAQKEYSKRWREKNIEKQREACRNWEKRNRAHINAKAKERMEKNPSFKMARRLRNRLYHALMKQGAKKSASSNSLIGCTIEFLKGYLEALFTPEMKWSNYGEFWEIDHKIPCSSYDLTDESHQRSCFHYTNLQPLKVFDNRQKSNRTQQSELNQTP